MNWSDLPSLASLRAFEAAARNLNLSKAGRDLNVTHAAIAQQIKSLESYFGVSLTERSGRGIALTPEGHTLYQKISQGFQQIADAVNDLKQAENDRAIHITMTPSFATSWFMDRLPFFQQAHPDISLSINVTADLVDLAAAKCDIAIRFGSGDWPNLESALLVKSNFVVVAAPNLIDHAKKNDPKMLMDIPWLQEFGTEEIKMWIHQQGYLLPPNAQIIDLPGHMILNAVRKGQGASATARIFVEEDLAAGNLVLLHEEKRTSETGYYLAWRPGIARRSVKKFLNWIKSEASKA